MAVVGRTEPRGRNGTTVERCAARRERHLLDHVIVELLTPLELPTQRRRQCLALLGATGSASAFLAGSWLLNQDHRGNH